MDILYKNIVTQLKTAVPTLRWIGWDNGEIDFPEKSKFINFPGILIDFPEYRPETVLENIQEGTLLIRLRIVFKIYDDMSSISPEGSQTAGFNILKKLNEIYAGLQGFSGPHYNRLERISQYKEQRDDNLTVYIMDFETNLRDAHAHEAYVEVDDVELNLYPNETPPATVANFSANKRKPDMNENVTFTDLSTDAPTAWAWVFTPNTVTFQTGTTASSRNPIVKFTEDKLYQVALTATNAFGSDTETKVDYIDVTVPD